MLYGRPHVVMFDDACFYGQTHKAIFLKKTNNFYYLLGKHNVSTCFLK